MNKFIGKITSFIFVVNDLFTLKCKVFILYDDMKAEYIGKVQPYQHESGYVYTDADDKPRFKVKGFSIAANYRNKTLGHGMTHVISLMHDFAKDFLNKINELQSLAARPIEDIKSVLDGTEFYCAHPLTAYITYKPYFGNIGEQKKMKSCGCKEPGFEIEEQHEHLESDSSYDKLKQNEIELYDSIMRCFGEKCKDMCFDDMKNMFECLTRNDDGFYTTTMHTHIVTSTKSDLLKSYMAYTSCTDNRYAEEFAEFLFLRCREKIITDIIENSKNRHPVQ